MSFSRLALVLAAVALAGCTTTKQGEQFRVEKSPDGKLVSIWSRDGAFVSKIVERAKVECAAFGKAEMITIMGSETTKEQHWQYYCSNGSAADKAIVEARKEEASEVYRAKARHAIAQGSPMTAAQLQALREEQVERLQKNAEGWKRLNSQRYCSILSPC
ncbi:MAG TPA: hypothetical protein VGE72_08850 [Azospirillum sp.]